MLVAGPEEMADQEGHAFRLAAAITPQVQDQRLAAGDQLHGGSECISNKLHGPEAAHLQVADIGRQQLDFLDAEAVVGDFNATFLKVLLAGSALARGAEVRIVANEEMAVLAHLTQVL